MVIQIKTDYIISPTKGDYALIDHIEAIPSVAYCYRARLIENSLSEAPVAPANNIFSVFIGLIFFC